MAFLTGKKKKEAERKHGFYRGKYVPIGLSLLLLLKDRLERYKSQSWTYTCHLIRDQTQSEELVNAWADFLDSIGISSCGAGFCTDSNTTAHVGAVRAPDWLQELGPATESRNELRLVLINDILKEAFNA